MIKWDGNWSQVWYSPSKCGDEIGNFIYLHKFSYPFHFLLYFERTYIEPLLNYFYPTELFLLILFLW